MRAGGKVNRGEESCISKTTLRLLSGSFRMTTLTACIAVGCRVKQEQLQLQLCLGSSGALLRYGLISREKRNYPESQSVGSVRRIISPWKCGWAVIPSCLLSEQSAFLTLGAQCVRGTVTELKAKMSCSRQLWLGGIWKRSLLFACQFSFTFTGAYIFLQNAIFPPLLISWHEYKCKWCHVWTQLHSRILTERRLRRDPSSCNGSWPAGFLRQQRNWYLTCMSTNPDERPRYPALPRDLRGGEESGTPTYGRVRLWIHSSESNERPWRHLAESTLSCCYCLSDFA